MAQYTKEQKKLLEDVERRVQESKWQEFTAASYPKLADTYISNNTMSNPVLVANSIYPSQLSTPVIGSYSGYSVNTMPTTKAPRVCDELDSLASLSAVDYFLSRRPDGVNIGLRHANKHPFELTCAEVHLEAAFRSALQLYLLPYFDLKK